MNKKLKSKIRKLKEENRKLKQSKDETMLYNSYIEIEHNFREIERKELTENLLKLFIRRHYSRLGDQCVAINIDDREVNSMKSYKLDIQKDIYNNLLNIRVR